MALGETTRLENKRGRNSKFEEITLGIVQQIFIFLPFIIVKISN